jgi:uncharacterized RDD family membrane protein YckC
MTSSPEPWQAPDDDGGPAPGVAFASPGARLVGYIIDIAITFAVILVIILVTAILAVIFAPLSILGILAFIIVPLAYFPYFWSKTGQTPGMKMMGIKVVRDKDGGPVTVGAAILRLIGYWISGAVFYLGYIWIFVDKRKRGWMDLIAGTIVISAPNDLSS